MISTQSKTKVLLNTIIEGIREKKGTNIVSMNLSTTESAICDYFIICQAESSRQVAAIAEYIRELTEVELKERPHHVEGTENAFWVLLDYIDVVVHVFKTEYRDFYKLENLWGDVDKKHYPDYV